MTQFEENLYRSTNDVLRTPVWTYVPVRSSGVVWSCSLMYEVSLCVFISNTSHYETVSRCCQTSSDYTKASFTLRTLKMNLRSSTCDESVRSTACLEKKSPFMSELTVSLRDIIQHLMDKSIIGWMVRPFQTKISNC